MASHRYGWPDWLQDVSRPVHPTRHRAGIAHYQELVLFAQNLLRWFRHQFAGGSMLAPASIEEMDVPLVGGGDWRRNPDGVQCLSWQFSGVSTQKTCTKCGAQFTGDTDMCWSCWTKQTLILRPDDQESLQSAGFRSRFRPKAVNHRLAVQKRIVMAGMILGALSSAYFSRTLWSIPILSIGCLIVPVFSPIAERVERARMQGRIPKELENALHIIPPVLAICVTGPLVRQLDRQWQIAIGGAMLTRMVGMAAAWAKPPKSQRR